MFTDTRGSRLTMPMCLQMGLRWCLALVDGPWLASGSSCELLPLAADATGAQAWRPKRRLAAALAICAGFHRTRCLGIALGEPWSRWPLSSVLGIPRYLSLFVHICTEFQCRSGLVWVLMRAGTGYGHPTWVEFYAYMGLDRSTMVVALFCTSVASSCTGVRVCVLAFRRWTPAAI